MLQLTDIHAGYNRTSVLHGVSIDVPRGQLVCLIGSNGAGKTTTMRVASGMLAPRAGRLALDAQPLDGLAAHHVQRLGVSHVPEGRRVFPSLSVLDNLEVGAYRRARFGLRPDVHDDLERVFGYFPRLKERRQQLAGTLSGGEQQMLAMGRALMGRPRMLLLDEPSMGLSPKLVDDVFGAIAELRGAGMTMLLVEQFAATALELADYAYVMENGRIALHGPARQLKGDPAVREAYLGKAH
ncbi:ABC transporter ATP-binding protein [Pseudorhodoferax soli]|uniref:Amino acid/amide ABC transporter ATP-binding protein 2 (HAAT family) n=1 Tax=Pseudorhodoferax soli TaxID=545864 RepID=A0A368Y0P4_9BURK|nr:ABC transporter ATP-binding protein [Pseudorhodoferax soli]RCW72868.1 amino acid/amide ABC transporter ATP-binding protein 2 (HAAT family) [Pseudorhodoferax soli]